MAFTTEFTQAQVDKITRAIATGVRKIEHGDKITEFQSIAAMIDLRDRMKMEIAAAAAAASSDPTPMSCMTRPTIFLRG